MATETVHYQGKDKWGSYKNLSSTEFYRKHDKSCEREKTGIVEA